MSSGRFQGSSAGLLSPLPILFLTVFIDMVGFGIVVPVLPLYTERFGASPFTTGLLLAVYSGMGFIFSPIVGTLSDRIGRRSILLLSTIGQATGLCRGRDSTTRPLTRAGIARRGIWGGLYLRASVGWHPQPGIAFSTILFRGRTRRRQCRLNLFYPA